MRAHILDAEALRAISPVALGAFARGEGWVRSEPYGNHSDVYVATGLPEIILPRTDRLGDYASVVSRLIEIFSKVTDRDELSTYRDLSAADRDVVRVRAIGADDDGSVALENGVKIIAQAREMLLAAACSVRIPQPIYRAGANRDAIEYMGRVRLGQTEHGSFVVTLLAPVPPVIPSSQALLDPTWAPFDDEPMERMVTRRLVEALEASRTAAEVALSGVAGAFESAVPRGVSANLCEAVASLIDQSDGLDISVTWARTRPTPEPHRKVVFSHSDAGILREAARNFRLEQPKPDVVLYGTVHKLKRDQNETEGVITLKAVVDDRIRSVTAVLDPVNYGVAVQAHDSKTGVIVTGDLHRAGQRWHLTNGNVRELPSDDELDEDSEG